MDAFGGVSDLFLVAVLLYLRRKRKKRKTQSFASIRLNLEGRIRRDRSIKRAALVDPEHSAWKKLYDSGHDGSLITVTGFDHAGFAELLRIYKPCFDQFTPWTGDQDGTTYRRLQIGANEGRGKKRIITAEASLALVLCWYRFRGAEFILQGWFGFTGTHNNVWLRFGRRMLLRVLKQHKEAKVEFPTVEEIEQLKEMVKSRHDALDGVYCFADGLKLMLEAAPGINIQGKYYNGWTHDHYITNLFVFSASGRIIACVVNAPGSLHDSTLCSWGGVYAKLEAVHDSTGGICCVDSAFQATNDYLLKSAQDTTKARNPQDMRRIQQATSLRQAAEWGMHAIQASMPRLKDRFVCEGEDKAFKEREVVMELVPLLYNFRLEFTGLNQIRTTYCLDWAKDADYLVDNF